MSRTTLSIQKFLPWVALFCCWILPGPFLVGQGIGITTPFTSAGDSYFESTGISWGFGIPAHGRVAGLNPNGQLTPQIGFSWGGGNIVPPFGGYNPNSAAQLNLQGPNFRFGLSMAKGSSRTLTSQAPSLMVQNGFGGSIFSGQVSPFVTGLIPVVGSPPLDNAVTRAIESGQLDLTYRPEDPPLEPYTGDACHSRSTATQGDLSVQAIKADRAKQNAGRQREFDALVAEAGKLSETGRPGMARQKLNKALELTDDEESKKVIRNQIENLRPSSSPK